MDLQNQPYHQTLFTTKDAESLHLAAAPRDDFFSEHLFEHEEGQLAVDVIDTKEQVIVISTMAGAIPEKIDVSVHNDLVTIRGIRMPPHVLPEGASYLYQECFWGSFSRTVVLPVDVKSEFTKAEYKNGVLTITIPKKITETKIPVVVIDD